MPSTLVAAQRGRGVGGEVGIARAGGADDDAALFHVVEGPASDVGLADLTHADGGEHARGVAVLLQGVLDGKGVHDRGQHAHVVG